MREYRMLVVNREELELEEINPSKFWEYSIILVEEKDGYLSTLKNRWEYPSNTYRAEVALPRCPSL